MERGTVLVFVGLLVIGVLEASYVHEMKVDTKNVYKTDPSKFTASNCSTAIPNRLVYFEKLDVSPNPIVFGHTETISFVLKILKNLGTKLSAKLELYMKIDGEWTDFCPLLGEQNCNMDDFCKTVGKLTPYIGFQVKCPIMAHKYALTVKKQIPSLSVGIEGTFNLTLTLIESGAPISCTNMIFCLNKCS